jgi:hypothetical protein
MSSIPSQAGDFCVPPCSLRDMGWPASSPDATSAVAPQIALRLALAQAMQGKLIGKQEAIDAMAAIEQLDQLPHANP